MYYLFCPQRRSYWRNTGGYTSDVNRAAIEPDPGIHPVVTPQNLHKMLYHSRTVAIPTSEMKIIETIGRMQPDVPSEVFPVKVAGKRRKS